MSKKFSCIIIEDESSSAEFIKNILAQNFPQIKVISTIATVLKAKKQLVRLEPDFIILDINLRDGSAFSLLKALNNIRFKILFITAHDKYAVEAFKFSALDFLLKPIYPDDFVLAIQKMIKELKNQQYHDQLETFFHNFSESNKTKKLVLKTLDATHIVNIDEIVYIKSENNYSNFILKEGKKILVSKTLKSFENRLGNMNFFRIHQSYMINLDYVRSFDKKNDVILLENDITIPVSQRKRRALAQYLGK